MLRSAAVAALLAAVPALARDVEGVKVPDAITVDGRELKLNGVGVRRATMFKVKVYVGALYLASPTNDAAAVVRSDDPKSVHMTFVRDVERGKIMETFHEGFRNNSGEKEAKELSPQLDRVARVIPAEMKPGQRLEVTWVPGKGTIVAAPGGEVLIEGKPFADAMFRNWFGKDPADGDLKQHMLGR